MQLLEIIQGTPIPTFVIDRDHVITHWNAACEHAIGFSAATMIGTRRQWEPFYPEERPVMADLILNEASEEEIAHHYGNCWRRSSLITDAFEAEDYYPHLGKDGLWLLFTGAPLRDAQGQIVGAIETLQDITDRKRAEQELLRYREQLEELVRQRTTELTVTNRQLRAEIVAHQAARAEVQQMHRRLMEEASLLQATNEELAQYAFVVSHDLRSPLRAIRNYTDFLLEELGAGLNEEQQQYFSGLRQALSHGEDLVRDLLDFSHIGRKEFIPQRIDAGISLRELVEGKNLRSDAEIVLAEHWPVVAADRMLFEQIFRNLISNGLKYNRSTQRRVELGWQQPDEQHAEIFVRDNGIGIDPRYHEQVFRMLQRLHSQKEFEGTGIGLAIVRKAANRLNGSVRLESQPDLGSTFYVTLPLWEHWERCNA